MIRESSLFLPENGTLLQETDDAMKSASSHSTGTIRFEKEVYTFRYIMQRREKEGGMGGDVTL